MPPLLHTTLFSLGVALLATALILPPGVAMGWILARFRWPGKWAVETLVALPLVVPPVATGLLLLQLIGRKSPLGQLWESWTGAPLVFTWKAVVVATAVMAFPLLVRSARVAFEEVPVRLEHMALTLGASRWRAFFLVTLPLAKRGLVAGAVLAFARALGEFGATMLVAGYIPGETNTLALDIYHYVQLGQDERAWAAMLVSLSLAAGALLVSERWVRKGQA